MGSNESRKAIYVKSFSQILKHTRHNTKIGELCFFQTHLKMITVAPPSLKELKMNTEVLDQQNWKPNELLVK